MVEGLVTSMGTAGSRQFGGSALPKSEWRASQIRSGRREDSCTWKGVSLEPLGFSNALPMWRPSYERSEHIKSRQSQGQHTVGFSIGGREYVPKKPAPQITTLRDMRMLSEIIYQWKVCATSSFPQPEEFKLSGSRAIISDRFVIIKLNLCDAQVF